MQFKQITHGSPEYDRECALRHRVLREPLDLDLYAEDLAAEAQELHFGLFSPAGDLAACLVASPTSKTAVKLRQMAVDEAFQGLGCGTELLTQVEEVLRSQGFKLVVLHARQAAIGFYERLGYQVTSGEFIQVTLPHVRMEKAL